MKTWQKALLGACSVGMMVGCDDVSNVDPGHVVTHKANKKLVCKSLRDSKSCVIEFKTGQAGADFYKYIEVGDTISGIGLRDGLVMNQFYTIVQYPGVAISRSRISKLNGRTLGEIERAAKYDSVINAIIMQERQGQR